jgi:hypothetical protein
MALQNTKITRSQPKAIAAKAEDKETEVRKAHEGRLWTRLVSPGSVIIKRVNDLAGMGRTLGLVAVAAVAGSLVLVMGHTLSAADAVKGWKVNQLEINKWAVGASVKSPSPAFSAAATKSEDYARFVSEVVANPSILEAQATGAAKPGNIPCVPMDSLSETWANPANGTPDRPRCKFSGNSVFVASFVQDASSGRNLIYPVLGVFHKEDGSWDYYNFDGGMESGIFALRDRKSVSIYQIAGEVERAFPGSLAKGDLTAARTAWGMAKKLFNKNN